MLSGESARMSPLDPSISTPRGKGAARAETPSQAWLWAWIWPWIWVLPQFEIQRAEGANWTRMSEVGV